MYSTYSCHRYKYLGLYLCMHHVRLCPHELNSAAAARCCMHCKHNHSSAWITTHFHVQHLHPLSLLLMMHERRTRRLLHGGMVAWMLVAALLRAFSQLGMLTDQATAILQGVAAKWLS